MILAGAGTDYYLLSSRSELVDSATIQRSLAVHTVGRGFVAAPPVPLNHQSLAGIDDDGLRLFWTVPPQRKPVSDAGAHFPKSGVYTAVYSDDAWSPAEVTYEGATSRSDYSPAVLRDRSGALHVAVTGTKGSSRTTVLHMHRSVDGWSTSEIPRSAPLYPRLAALSSGGMVLVSVGAAPGARDVNSVWAQRYDPDEQRWSTPHLISRSGVRGAYEPSVIEAGPRVHVVWAKDIDGIRTTREALWYAYSEDDGTTWSVPQQVASARHIWRPALVEVDSGAIAVLYLQSSNYGSPGSLRMSVLSAARWRAVRPPLHIRASDFSVLGAARDSVRVVFPTFHTSARIQQPGIYYTASRCRTKGGDTSE